MDKEVIARELVDSAIKVHKLLGPGLLESAYEACLAHEMDMRGIPYGRQLLLPISYEGIGIDAGYRLDLLLDGQVVVELKSVQSLSPVHEAQ